MGKINDLIQRFLGEPTRNLIHAMYDDYVEANVRFRSRAGIKTFIIRREMARCCDWCHALAGIHESGKEPNNVYRRHDNCRCMVTFRNEKGTYTDAWSKREFQTQKDARASRIKDIEAELKSRKSRGQAVDSSKGFYDGLTRKEMVRRQKAGKRIPDNRGIIAEKVLNGEYDLKYKPQKYEQHTKGHIRYEQATKDRNTQQSYLTISKDEAQELIYKYAGTGIIDDDITREFVTVDKFIGCYYNKKGEEIPTKRIMILYAKKGTHIVPVKDRK